MTNGARAENTEYTKGVGVRHQHHWSKVLTDQQSPYSHSLNVFELITAEDLLQCVCSDLSVLRKKHDPSPSGSGGAAATGQEPFSKLLICPAKPGWGPSTSPISRRQAKGGRLEAKASAEIKVAAETEKNALGGRGVGTIPTKQQLGKAED